MKIPHILAVLLLSASSALATVTLQFSSATVYTSNFANSQGATNTNMAWGIVIDAGNDGFDFNTSLSYFYDVNLVAGGQSLRDGSGAASDDYLFIAPNLMVLTTLANDGAPIGINRITALAAVPVGTNGINSGDNFAIVWFDRTALSGATLYGERFGVLTNAGFVIPADGNTTSFSSLSAGADPVKPMSFGFIPEPSSAALGLLAAVGLLRRRRR